MALIMVGAGISGNSRVAVLLFLIAVTTPSAGASEWFEDYRGLPGLKFTTPQGVCLSLTAFVDGGPGVFIQVEPGPGGGKLHLGVGAATGGFGVIYGAGIKASVLRTWDDPIDRESNQTYVGAELELMVYWINLNAGAYTHVHGNDTDSDWIFSDGIGLGF